MHIFVLLCRTRNVRIPVLKLYTYQTKRVCKIIIGHGGAIIDMANREIKQLMAAEEKNKKKGEVLKRKENLINHLNTEKWERVIELHY